MLRRSSSFQGALDNLLKGAATQCLQNLNLALGYEEYSGIPKASNAAAK
jgi:N-acetyl-gamma-glutamyl-phosphate reductase/acetylglutamate kinase